ncbi:MAG: TM2 domain-containing protein [Actinobacteria bacterium]|nr:TM2 domain-containing protein [Actinomycetota bacterium]
MGGILVGILVVIIIIAVAASGAGKGSSTASTNNTTQAAASTPTQAGSMTTTKAAAPTTAAAAADPVKTFTDQFGTFAAISKSGSGSSVIPVPSGAKAGILTATYSGSANFVISVLDANNQSTGDLLVNTIGKYSGTTAFGLSSFGGEPAKFKIEASGPWTVNIQSIASAPALALPATDKGDKVFIYTGQADSWAITNNSKGNFVVTLDGKMPDLLVNEIGNYSGTVPVTRGPAILSVQSDGAWTISKG